MFWKHDGQLPLPLQLRKPNGIRRAITKRQHGQNTDNQSRNRAILTRFPASPALLLALDYQALKRHQFVGCPGRAYLLIKEGSAYMTPIAEESFH